jgi:hypothetical protein
MVDISDGERKPEKITFAFSRGGSGGGNIRIKVDGRDIGHFYPDGCAEDIEQFYAQVGEFEN